VKRLVDNFLLKLKQQQHNTHLDFYVVVHTNSEKLSELTYVLQCVYVYHI